MSPAQELLECIGRFPVKDERARESPEQEERPNTGLGQSTRFRNLEASGGTGVLNSSTPNAAANTQQTIAAATIAGGCQPGSVFTNASDATVKCSVLAMTSGRP